MIHDIFKYLSDRLNEHLKKNFQLPEELVEVISVGQELDIEAHQNKVVLSLINIERETAMGIQVRRKVQENGVYEKLNPSWHLNLIFIIASISNQKQYLQSLKLLSSSIEFFQTENQFNIPGNEKHSSNVKITVEPMNASAQELSNVWSVLGGKYYPSIICKIRMITIDSDQVSSIEKSSDEIKTNIKNVE